MPHLTSPNDFELIVMMAILGLPGKAGALQLREEIERRTEQEVSYGALYTTLERLVVRGWLRCHSVPPGIQSPAVARRLYHFTVAGLKAFRGSGVEVQVALEEPWLDRVAREHDQVQA